GTTHWMNAFPEPLDYHVCRLSEAMLGLLKKPNANGPFGANDPTRILHNPTNKSDPGTAMTPPDQWDRAGTKSGIIGFWNWLTAER
ncbi:MAG: hypothetical protein SFV23_26495, partial [Planctomycetaceae bacterium]|nr:hypothetical protein [Planctomycetaceae bacterium]